MFYVWPCVPIIRIIVHMHSYYLCSVLTCKVGSCVWPYIPIISCIYSHAFLLSCILIHMRSYYPCGVFTCKVSLCLCPCVPIIHVVCAHTECVPVCDHAFLLFMYLSTCVLIITWCVPVYGYTFLLFMYLSTCDPITHVMCSHVKCVSVCAHAFLSLMRCVHMQGVFICVITRSYYPLYLSTCVPIIV